MCLLQTKKRMPLKASFSLILAERTGFEPATPCVTGRYSNQLNYRSVVGDKRLELLTSAL